MDNRNLFYIFTTLLIPAALFSQHYPALSNVIVGSSVNYVQPERMYYYNYSLTNPLSSVGKIMEFEIDISRNANSMDLDTTGLKFENDGFTERFFRRDYSRLKENIVPLSFLKTPGIWSGDLMNNLRADLHGDSRLLINPGETLGGFIIMSRGLPGIRLCVVIPRFNVDEFFPSLEDTTATISIAQMDSIREVVNFYGWTVGPYAPPATFDANVLLDTLTSFTARSRALGWLKAKKEDEKDKDDGELKELDKRLTEARKALVKGDSSKAREELEEFVEKVEEIYKESMKAEEKKKEQEIVMTSEAYALLKFNAEYLINKLPRKKK